MLVFLIICGVVAFLIALVVYNSKFNSRISTSSNAIISSNFIDVFGVIKDFKSWRHWNPWLQHEQGVLLSFSAASDNIGGNATWSSRYLSYGKITNKGIQKYTNINQAIQFNKFAIKSAEINWNIGQGESSSNVTCNIRITVPFWLKWKANKLKQQINRDCEYGLHLLNIYVNPHNDGQDGKKYKIDFATISHVDECHYVYDTYNGTMEGLATNVAKSFKEIFTAISHKNGKITNMPFCLYRKFNNEKDFVSCEIAIPVSKDFSLVQYKKKVLPKMHTLKSSLTGDLSHLPIVWHQATTAFKIKKLKPVGKIKGIEVYATNLDSTDTENAVTHVHIPYYK